ncbi:MAG: prolyl oligopeptidase family serine peptidase [Pseudonocardiaceae bacterium]|nr:prolyl oligopeptidase family serine peptidase [Pseudonocardiaceae bacterium]
MSQPPAVPGIRHQYGSHPDQFGHFYPGNAESGATIALVHGGFWRAHRDLTMLVPVAADLTRRGWHVWNIEYRRGRSWHDTLADCAVALDYLGDLAAGFDLDTERVVMLGHSAGGHLVTWCAGRAPAARRAGSPLPKIVPAGVVSAAGVLDLAQAFRWGIGERAVTEFLGGSPDEVPDAFRQADPMARLPTGVRLRCLHGPDDERVPVELSHRYARAARANGDDVTVTEVPGNHADIIDVGHPAWRAVVDAVGRLATY